MRKETKTLGVRLTDTERALIEERARKMGLRPSTYAKKLLLEAALEEDPASELPGIRERLDELEGELQELRRVLRNSMLRLLTQRKPMTPEEANAWARERLE